VPDEPVHLVQDDPGFRPGRVEQAHFHRSATLENTAKFVPTPS